jgi:hypothetical protein
MENQGTRSLAADVSAGPDAGLAIDLRRVDIEMALGSADDGVVELLLDLEAREVDGGTTRRRTLAVGCTPADLERMLEVASDSVRVSFDAEALARAIDPDIEAHGLREKMAVLAIVVATTGAAAGSAQAMPTLAGQGGSGAATVASARDMPADSLSASAASAEGAAATRANPSDAAAATIVQDARLAEQTRLDLRHQEVLSASHPAAPPMATQTAPDVPSDSVEASQTPAVARVAAGTEAGSVDSTTFVIVGGIALALLGAAFGATAATRKTPTPT